MSWRHFTSFLTVFCHTHGDHKYDWLLCNKVPFKKISHCMIRIMSWTESILRPIQQYFSYIRAMIGKYDWFCEMKCRSGSEGITRAFRSWERYFRVQETAHNQIQFFLRVSRNRDYFHLFSYLNESHFERYTFSFTRTQFQRYTTV